MRYTRLGATGMEVSVHCLGCFAFGDPSRGWNRWSIPEPDSRALIRQAVEAGINFFDTANTYSDGHSEEILGRAIADFCNRDEIVVATKVWGRTRPGPNGAGLSRKAILSEIDASLGRLGLEYVDLYQVHRWDPNVEIAETLEALNDVVKAGKARYVGASSMWAWQLAKANFTAATRRVTPFVSIQDHFNLIGREAERELLPYCDDQAVGVLAWSPLARGRLARDWRAPMTQRSESDAFDAYLDEDRAVIDVVAAVAAEREVSRAQVALAWVTDHAQIDAAIIGVTRPQQLDEAVGSIGLALTESERRRLEAEYRTRAMLGLHGVRTGLETSGLSADRPA